MEIIFATGDDDAARVELAALPEGSPAPFAIMTRDGDRPGVAVFLTKEQLEDLLMSAIPHVDDGEEFDDEDDEPETADVLAELDFEPTYTDPGRLTALRQAREVIGDGPYYTHPAADTLVAVANWLLGEEE